MLPFRLVYHERYDLHLGDHVFPSKKFKWLHDRLLWTRFAYMTRGVSVLEAREVPARG